MLRVSKVADGQKNFTLQITGVLRSEQKELLEIQLGDNSSKLKLASLVWVVQEKLGLYLWWDKETPLIPMESRNSVRFDHALQPPEKWEGKMYVTSFNFEVGPLTDRKWFFLVLDFDR
jgi:hypothetical protein